MEDDAPIDQSYRPLASSQLAGKYSISMTAEYRAAAAIANAKTPTVPMPHVDSLATEDGGMGAFDTLGVDDGSMRIDTAVHNFDKFDGSGSLPPQTQMVEETPRSEMDRRAGGGGGGGGVGSPNNGGTGYVRKRSGVGGQRLRFSVGAAANGSLTIAEENEEDTCRLEEDTCRLDAEDTCYTHAEEEGGCIRSRYRRTDLRGDARGRIEGPRRHRSSARIAILGSRIRGRRRVFGGIGRRHGDGMAGRRQ